MENSRKKNRIEKTIILVLAAFVLLLLVFFLRSIFFPLLRFELKGNTAAARDLLEERGILGCITVSLIEALQMVVIFIPAEFIQLSSSMSYPWWLALLLCDAGIAAGASIIYFIVHVFRFNGDLFHNTEKIEHYAKMNRQKSAVIFMYLLFIMPVIPFGAICYYGAGRKIRYPRYLLTCTTGVIPSICTSILMGTALREFIVNDLPVWALILAIVCAAAILFTLLYMVLSRFFFRQSEGTPDHFMNGVMSRIVHRMAFGFRVRLHNAEPVRRIDGPYLLLSNHHCFFDPDFVRQIDPDRNSSFVVNRYYRQVPFVGKSAAKYGYIYKKIFDTDLDAVRSILKMKSKGYPIIIFPEARLSPDGCGGIIPPGTASLAKKLKIPTVLVQVRGAYLRKPKWRRSAFRGPVDVEVMRILRPEELSEMSNSEILRIMNENLLFNEFDYPPEKPFRSCRKAKGLENLLYMCPHCRTLYSNRSKGNLLICSSCGKEYRIKDDYTFDDPQIRNLADYYARIIEIERENIGSFSLTVPVDTKIFGKEKKDNRTDRGIFRFDRHGVSYESETDGTSFSYTVRDLEGIAFSVNEEFEMYWRDELYYFYPRENRAVCTRTAAVFEMLKKEYDEHIK